MNECKHQVIKIEIIRRMYWTFTGKRMFGGVEPVGTHPLPPSIRCLICDKPWMDVDIIMKDETPRFVLKHPSEPDKIIDDFKFMDEKLKWHKLEDGVQYIIFSMHTEGTEQPKVPFFPFPLGGWNDD